MAANHDFDVALAFGEGRETALKDALEDKNIEVKSQTTSRSHVFIEWECRGKPSGLAVTKADFWAIEVYPDTWVVLPTDDLKVITRKAYEHFGRREGGDDMAAIGTIIPITWLVLRNQPPA